MTTPVTPSVTPGAVVATCCGPDFAWESEALCRTRTGDPFLTMEVLYQLS